MALFISEIIGIMNQFKEYGSESLEHVGILWEFDNK